MPGGEDPGFVYRVLWVEGAHIERIPHGRWRVAATALSGKEQSYFDGAVVTRKSAGEQAAHGKPCAILRIPVSAFPKNRVPHPDEPPVGHMELEKSPSNAPDVIALSDVVENSLDFDVYVQRADGKYESLAAKRPMPSSSDTSAARASAIRPQV